MSANEDTARHTRSEKQFDDKFDAAFWNKMRKIIREEVSIELKDTVGKLEKKVDDLLLLGQNVHSLKESIEFQSKRFDDLKTKELPSLATHYNKVVTAMALQNVDLNMHRRKWSVVIHGIPGRAGEDNMVTRKAVVDMAMQQLGIPHANLHDFGACHRLKQDANAGIIARFLDLSTRDEWLANCKNLRNTRISINVDLPPCLREVNKQLATKKKDLPPDIKRRSYIRHLPSWPYLYLQHPDRTRTNHTFTKESLAQKALSNLEGSLLFNFSDN